RWDEEVGPRPRTSSSGYLAAGVTRKTKRPAGEDHRARGHGPDDGTPSVVAVPVRSGPRHDHVRAELVDERRAVQVRSGQLGAVPRDLAGQRAAVVLSEPAGGAAHAHE